MSYIFLLLFFLSIIGLIVGIITPKFISKVLKISLPRKKIGLVFGALALVFFILTGVTPLPTQVASDQLKKEAQIQATSSSSLQSSSPPSTIQKIVKAIIPTNSAETFKVTKVVDGDTIDVDINGKVETLRLIGIDTPETVDPRKPVQCFGIEASNKAKSVLNGQSVRLEADNTQGERDKYSRLLRYAFLLDGTNFNKMMISEGYAHEYTYQSNPYKYQNEFKQAEKEARDNKRGLWADNTCAGNITSGSATTNYTAPVIDNSSGKYSCGSKKYCTQMASCEEAKFYLNNCGLSRLDGDHDGIPCESLCN